MSARLRQSVGPGAANLAEDVATVQFLLGHVPTAIGGSAALAVDGGFGGGTQAAISAFQNRHFAFQNGRIDPGDITMLRLQHVAMTSGGFGFDIFARSRHKVAEIIGFSAAAIDHIDDGEEGSRILVTDDLRKIYSHPLHGTWEVDGDLLGLYEVLGEQAGQLGHPISGQRRANNTDFNLFTNGRIDRPDGQLASETIFS